MAKGDAKLLGFWASPFVMRPRIALNIKSVDYEFLEETVGTKSDLLLKSNPIHKKIPVLIHEGKPICESLIIVEYIDETWSSGPPILPSDPYDRAIVRFWGAYVDEKWFPCMRGIPGAQSGEARKASFDQVVAGLTLLEDAYGKFSQGKPFFGGDQIGYLDIAFGSYLGWLRATEAMTGEKLLDIGKVPGLVKWADCFSSDPVVKDVLPETDKLVEFGKVIQARMRASAPPQ